LIVDGDEKNQCFKNACFQKLNLNVQYTIYLRRDEMRFPIGSSAEPEYRSGEQTMGHPRSYSRRPKSLFYNTYNTYLARCSEPHRRIDVAVCKSFESEDPLMMRF